MCKFAVKPKSGHSPVPKEEKKDKKGNGKHGQTNGRNGKILGKGDENEDKTDGQKENWKYLMSE
jgi:hypothetical protein